MPLLRERSIVLLHMHVSNLHLRVPSTCPPHDPSRQPDQYTNRRAAATTTTTMGMTPTLAIRVSVATRATTDHCWRLLIARIGQAPLTVASKAKTPGALALPQSAAVGLGVSGDVFNCLQML